MINKAENAELILLVTDVTETLNIKDKTINNKYYWFKNMVIRDLLSIFPLQDDAYWKREGSIPASLFLISYFNNFLYHS